MFNTIRRIFYSNSDENELQGHIDIYLGDKIIVDFMVCPICIQSYPGNSSLSFYIHCNYLNNSRDELHDQIQSILNYIWITFSDGLDEGAVFKDFMGPIDTSTEESITLWDELHKSMIPYDKNKLKDISFDEMYPNTKYEGFLSKNVSGKVVFEFDDYDILSRFAELYISVRRDFYLNDEALLNRKYEGFISITYSDKLHVLTEIENKKIIKYEIEINHKNNICDIVEFILNYFTCNNSYIYRDLLMEYGKFTREKLEKLLKLDIAWNSEKNRHSYSNEDWVYKKCMIEKDNNGDFQLIIL